MSASEAVPQKRPRPLSPHLQIYRPQISSALSIFHRATGIALSVGTLLLAWWVIAAAAGPEAFAAAQWFALRRPCQRRRFRPPWESRG